MASAQATAGTTDPASAQRKSLIERRVIGEA
jgi:hypothetical protein